MAMEPEACIAPPEGNGEPLEEVSGGRGRFHGASSVGNCLALGVLRTLFVCSAGMLAAPIRLHKY